MRLGQDISYLFCKHREETYVIPHQEYLSPFPKSLGFRSEKTSVKKLLVFAQNPVRLCLFQWHWPCSSPWQVSGSVLSVYSGDFGSVDAQGMVEFALDYDEKNREFQVHVSQCKDLAVVDEKKGRSDPWVMFLWLLHYWILCSGGFLFSLNVMVSSFLPSCQLIRGLGKVGQYPAGVCFLGMSKLICSQTKPGWVRGKHQ